MGRGRAGRWTRCWTRSAKTPLVRLHRVAPDIELFAKVEWYGPTGSVKDRIYAHMLAKAEAEGRLRPGMTIIECTTGNAGIACSAVAAIKGYACTIVMPQGMSPERKRMIEAYGARLVLTPGAGTDIDLALAEMRRHRRRGPRRVLLPRGVREPGQPRGAGGQRERDLGAARRAGRRGRRVAGDRRLDHRGHARAEGQPPGVVAYAVEPAECPLISEQRWGTHGVPGIGDGIIPRNLDLAAMDGIVTVSTADALEMARRMAREEGLLCGPSSGMNVVAAQKVAAKHPELRRFVTVVPDTGQRYL